MTAVAEPMTRVTSEAVHARREERLLRLLERSSASSRFNLGERWLFALGGALVLSGFVAVIIGYVGTSRTVLVSGQIPYVVSGGLLGLGLIFLGAFLYFGHWVAVLVRESRERGAEDREDLALVRQNLEDVHRSLVAVATALGAVQGVRAPVTSASIPAASTNGTAPLGAPIYSERDITAPVLLATTTGTMAHRPGCKAIAGKPNLRSVSAADGLKPCGMCSPLDYAGLE